MTRISIRATNEQVEMFHKNTLNLFGTSLSVAHFDGLASVKENTVLRTTKIIAIAAAAMISAPTIAFAQMDNGMQSGGSMQGGMQGGNSMGMSKSKSSMMKSKKSRMMHRKSGMMKSGGGM